MNSYPVEFLKAAKLDIKHAKNWYNFQRINLGNEFLFEVEKLQAQIQANPEQFPKSRNEITENSSLCQRMVIIACLVNV